MISSIYPLICVFGSLRSSLSNYPSSLCTLEILAGCHCSCCYQTSVQMSTSLHNTHTLGPVTIGWGSERMLMSTQPSCCYFFARFGQREESIETGRTPLRGRTAEQNSCCCSPSVCGKANTGGKRMLSNKTNSCYSLLPDVSECEFV